MPEVPEYYTLVYMFTTRPPKTQKKKYRNNEEQRDNKNSDKAPEP